MTYEYKIKLYFEKTAQQSYIYYFINLHIPQCIGKF